MTQGYLYVMHNECYTSYDKDFYKCGRTCNLEQRMNSYQTPFKEKSIYMYTSQPFDNCIAAEYVLFCMLKKYRVHPKREFFICPLETIIKTIKLLETVEPNDLQKLYEKLRVSTYTNWLIKKVFPETEQLLDLSSDELDEHLSQFIFKPKHPEMYYKYGYRDDNWRQYRLDEIERRLKLTVGYE